MRLIVGLGNPDEEHIKTRHNAGFMVIDRLAARHNFSSGRSKFHGLALEGTIAGERCVLLKPMTYMNRSGLAVGAAATFYKLAPQDLLIVVDDFSLAVGRLRLRDSGSAGGHNGLADIEVALGTPAYPRLRIGIDPPGPIPYVEYVLRRFTSEQMTKLEPALDLACDAIACWIKDGIAKAMTRFNGSG